MPSCALQHFLYLQTQVYANYRRPCSCAVVGFGKKKGPNSNPT